MDGQNEMPDGWMDKSALHRRMEKSALPHAQVGKSTLHIQMQLPSLGLPVLPVLAYPDIRDKSVLHARTNKSVLHEWMDKSVPPHTQTDKLKLHIQTRLPACFACPASIAYPDALHILTRPLLTPSILSHVPIHPTPPEFMRFIDPALYYQFPQG